MKAPPRNLLFELFPESDRNELVALGHSVDLHVGDALQGRPNKIASVYFPLTACLSVHARTPAGGPEVMKVGFEGALGVQLALRPDAQPLSATVQCPGTALRIDGADFCRQIEKGGALLTALDHYLEVVIQQVAISCGCVQAHPVAERLAKQLLMSHDRARHHDFHVTHDFLATVLAVRRAGVSSAAAQLQRAGLISYNRGMVCIVDRKGLLAASCSCYGTARRAYSHAMDGVARRVAA